MILEKLNKRNCISPGSVYINTMVSVLTSPKMVLCTCVICCCSRKMNCFYEGVSINLIYDVTVHIYLQKKHGNDIIILISVS